jgi:CCR4-NOT transcription complex subunit 6
VSTTGLVSLASALSCDVKPDGAISLVSWNLLAPIYASPQKYPWSESGDLDWKYRKPRIIEQLRRIDADVVCLQEMQVDLWEEFRNDMRDKLDYDQAILQKMGRNHPVANAILVKKDCRLRVVRTESRSRVLIAVLQALHDDEEKENPATAPLYLANVHLEAGMDEDDIRLAQIRSLCKRLTRHVDEEDHHPAILFCGDFNTVRDSPLYTFLQTGAYTLTNEDNFIHTEIHSPLLPLRDAYLELHRSDDDLQLMSFRSGHLLDYLWVSNAIQVLCTMPVEHQETEPKPWPDSTHPSDHVPIGALISWPGAPPMLASARQRPSWQTVKIKGTA